MGHYVMKAVHPTDGDRDLYVYWSTVVDAPFMWGTREEMADYVYEQITSLREDKHPELAAMKREEVEERWLARADELGSSSYMRNGWWGEDVNYHNAGRVPRDKLAAFLDSFVPINEEEGEGEFDLSLLEPFDYMTCARCGLATREGGWAGDDYVCDDMEQCQLRKNRK